MLQEIDVDALRCKLTGMKNGEQYAAPRGMPFDTADVILCCSLEPIRGSQNPGIIQRIVLLRMLLRYAPESEEECRYAYTLCWEAWNEDSTT